MLLKETGTANSIDGKPKYIAFTFYIGKQFGKSQRLKSPAAP